MTCNINNPKIPCRIFAKNVHHKDKIDQCDLCALWINFNWKDYMQNCDESWYYTECSSTIFCNQNSSLLLKFSPNLELSKPVN